MIKKIFCLTFFLISLNVFSSDKNIKKDSEYDYFIIRFEEIEGQFIEEQSMSDLIFLATIGYLNSTNEGIFLSYKVNSADFQPHDFFIADVLDKNFTSLGRHFPAKQSIKEVLPVNVDIKIPYKKHSNAVKSFKIKLRFFDELSFKPCPGIRYVISLYRKSLLSLGVNEKQHKFIVNQDSIEELKNKYKSKLNELKVVPSEINNLITDYLY